MMLSELDDVERFLEKESKSIENPSGILDAITTLGSRTSLLKLLENTSKNPRWISRIAAESYLHNNGFFKVVLIKRKPFFELRLHVWKDSMKTGFPELSHNHSWSFASKILFGELSFAVFTESRSGDSVVRYECGFNKGEQSYYMLKIGETGLRKDFECRMSAGSVYYMPEHTIHRIFSSDTPLCATLMLHSSVSREISDVYLNAQEGAPLPENVPKKYLTDCQVQAILAECAHEYSAIAK